MFFGFFSDFEYSKTRWNEVFCLENSIQSYIREFWPAIIGLSDDELIQHIKDMLLCIGSQNELSISLDETFVDFFLNSETPFLTKYQKVIKANLKKIKKNGFDSTLANQPSFMLKKSYLIQCIENNPAFFATETYKPPEGGGVCPSTESRLD